MTGVDETLPHGTFESWYAKRSRFVTQVAEAQTGSHPDAEDVAADVCVQLVTNWSELGRVANLDSYAARMVVNRVRSEARRRAAARSRYWLSQAVVDSHTGDNSPISAEFRDLLERYVGDRTRVMIYLRYWLMWHETEIADKLGLSRGLVAMTLARGRTALKQALIF